MPAASWSQIKKGSFILSGKSDVNLVLSKTTLSMDSIAIPRMKNTQFGFDLGAGYVVAANLAVAVSGAYSYADTKFEPYNFDPGKEVITTTFAVVPQVIYYFFSGEKIKPTLSAGIGYIWMKERASNVSTNNNNIVYSLTGPSINGAIGMSYFITRDISFDLGLQYTHNRLKDKTRTHEIQNQNTIAAILGITIIL